MVTNLIFEKRAHRTDNEGSGVNKIFMRDTRKQSHNAVVEPSTTVVGQGQSSVRAVDRNLFCCSLCSSILSTSEGEAQYVLW